LLDFQQLSIFAGFALLALIYALGTLSAFHARNLLRDKILELSFELPGRKKAASVCAVRESNFQ